MPFVPSKSSIVWVKYSRFGEIISQILPVIHVLPSLLSCANTVLQSNLNPEDQPEAFQALIVSFLWVQVSFESKSRMNSIFILKLFHYKFFHWLKGKFLIFLLELFLIRNLTSYFRFRRKRQLCLQKWSLV